MASPRKLLHLEVDAAALGARHRGDLEAVMAQGYEAMSELNLALAKEDEATLAEWPDFDVKASEADPSGDS